MNCAQPAGSERSSALRPARPIFPTWFVAGVALSILGTLGLTALYRATDRSAVTHAVAASAVAIAERHLLFQDTPSGDVAILDADSGQSITRLGLGDDGFMRSVMRGLARQRLAAGAGPESPFILTAWQGGSVSLVDPVNGHYVELTAFGPDNTSAFTRLLERAP